MRTELGRYNVGTRAEVRFFFEKDDQTGQFYYVQAGPKGDRRLSMKAAVDQPFYRRAVEAAQTLLNESADASLSGRKTSPHLSNEGRYVDGL